jgi:hypothetical protein
MTDSWELEGSDGKTRLTVVESGFDPRQPAVPGLDRLAGRHRRAAALPRTPAAAHDLAPDRDRRVPEGMFSSID